MMFVIKWLLEYQKVIKTNLSTYLWDSSDGSDSSDSSHNSYSNDSSDISDSSDSSESSDSSNITDQQIYIKIVINLKNSNCDETHKLKLWWNSKLQLWWNSKT